MARENGTDPGMPRESGLDLRMRSEGRRIQSQHQQLQDFAAMVLGSLEQGSLRAARVAFTRFRDALEAHLALEDQIWFPALHGLRPDFGPELSSLAEEHVGMRQTLEDLFELLAAGSAEPFRELFAGLCDRITAHEAREEDLLSRRDGAH